MLPFKLSIVKEYTKVINSTSEDNLPNDFVDKI